MMMYKTGLLGSLYTGALLLAQLAASYEMIRLGCIFFLVGGFLYLILDFLDDRAKAEIDGEVLTFLTLGSEHLRYCISLVFVIVLGVILGW